MNDNKKVIIDLDEYLEMKEENRKLRESLDALVGNISVDTACTEDPLSGRWGRDIITVDGGSLKEFINALMDTKELEVNIIRENFRKVWL